MVVSIPVERHVEDYLKSVAGETIVFNDRLNEPNLKILYVLMERPVNKAEAKTSIQIANYTGKIQIQICDEWKWRNKHGLTPADTQLFNNLVSSHIYNKLEAQLIGAGEGYNFSEEYRRFIELYEINDAHFPYERAKKHFQRHKPLIINEK